MDELPVCARCEEEYSPRAGMDPSKYCDLCAQELVSELEAAVDVEKALYEALKAFKEVWGTNKKIDESVSWDANDGLAIAKANEAIALYESKGKL